MRRLRLALFMFGLFSVFFFGFEAAEAQAKTVQPTPNRGIAMKRGYLKLKDGVERYIEWTPAQPASPLWF